LSNRHLARSIPGAARGAHRASRAAARHKPEFERRDLSILARSFLAPDVFALRNGAEDAVPSAARVKNRHAQHQHRVMSAPTRAEPSPRFLLIFDLHCNYFLSLGCSKSVAKSANTSAQKIDVIMADPRRAHSHLSPTAAAQSSSATSELRIRKVFLAHVAANRQSVWARKTERPRVFFAT
jgi:hypothetical protein